MVHLSIASVISLIVILVITIILFACNNSSGESLAMDSKDGIVFSNNTLEQAAAQSKQDSKPVFLLAHASYCSSCKKMKKSVFSEKEIGDLFNKCFINAQVDIESEEGRIIVKDYDITATPTLIFISPDGRVINKTSGFHNKEELIAVIKDLSLNGKSVCK
jgi:thioredoxin-related protein